MKNQIYLITACILASSTHLVAQTNQLKKWFIAPKVVEMPFGTSPSVIPMPTVNGVAPAQTNQVANGIYDENDNLLFYVSDNSVYDYNNSLIGDIDPPNGGAEIVIVPFGNNNSCRSKFNIFTTTSNQIGLVSLTQTIVDLKSLSLTNTIVFSMTLQREFGALALSKHTGGIRNLYFLAGSGTIGSQGGGMIYKLTVNNNGSVTSPTLIFPTTPYLNDGAEVFSRELDLSPDGKYLAWSSLARANSSPTQYRYHFIALDLSGNYDPGTYQQFNIPGITGNNVSGFRGVEFSQSGAATKLFMGAGTDGIYYTDIPNVSGFTNVTNSALLNFGLSQIEHSFNGYMYAASGNSSTGNVGAFDPSDPVPMIVPSQSFTLTNPLPPNSGFDGAALYTLPDQIDGQNYDQIVPVSVPPIVTASSYNISSGGLVTWIYGSGSNNPWGSSTPVQIFHELRISGNTKLTINGMTFKFSPNARVIVENGSSLTLDIGTVFTSNHDAECNDNYSWIGAEVWGSPTNQSQNINPPVVGKLTLKNGSKIENAQWGARAQRSDVLNNSYRGGIIVGESGSMFVNNKTDVQFLPYQNINNGITYGNRSYFSNTTFTNTADYAGLFTFAPVHVSIEDNRGIRFTGCHFLNDDTNVMFQKQSVGIKSANSGFSVTGGSTFSNLYRAIEAYRYSGTHTFTITNSTFTNNEVAIYSWNVHKISVHRNIFIIGGHQRQPGGAHFGIRHFNGTGYSIQENLFDASSGTPSNKIGIQIINSGTAANQVYKNTFKDLNFGNYASGQNRANNPYGNLQGLQWLCNKNINNTINNFYVSGSGSDNGVRLFQGTATFPAANDFTASGSNYSHIHNATSSALTYYYQSIPYQAPQWYNAPKVVPTQVNPSSSNSCPSLLCVPACDQESLTSIERSQLQGNYDSLENVYANVLYAYNQLMDDGNTNGLLNAIALNWSADATALFNELMARSPFLSQEILRDVAMRDVLPHAMMLTICLANPDATRDDGFLYYLLTEIPNPLPQYMIDLIIASWDDATARTAMENAIASHNQQMAYLADRLLIDSYYKSGLGIDQINTGDTINYHQQVIYWLNRTWNMEAKYELSEYLFTSGDSASAQLVMDSIPMNFSLSEEQQSAHSDYVYFYNFRKTHFADGNSLSDLDSNQINQLTAYIQGRQNFATGMIQNVLCFHYGICPEYEFGESGYRFMYHSNAPGSLNTNPTAGSESKLTIAPNPAFDQATIQYQLPGNMTHSMVVISDLTGRELLRVPLPHVNGEVTIDVGSLGKGVYYYYLEQGSRKLNKGKLSIIR